MREPTLAAVTLSLALACGGAGVLGLGSEPAPELCLRVSASPSANSYGGQPHAVRLLILPLESTLAFEQASEDSLLAGAAPKGAAGDPIDVRLVPGEERSLTDPLPLTARSLDIVADYFRAPGAIAGRRKLTVSASCASGETRLFLDESEIRLP